MTYRIGGQVVDQGTGVSGQPVFVVDTDDANPSNWTVESATTTNADGSWSVVVNSGGLERYHAVTQFEDGSTLKNAESKPFVTGQPVLRPVEVPIQFNIPAPLTIGRAIPDSAIQRRYAPDLSETDGQTVDPWDDSIGDVPLAANNTPTLAADAVNNVDAVNINGTDEGYRYVDNLSSNITEPVTIIWAISVDSLPSNGIVTLWNDGVDNIHELLFRTDKSGIQFRIDGTNKRGGTPTTGDQIITMTVSSENGATLRKNGSDVVSISASNVSDGQVVLSSSNGGSFYYWDNNSSRYMDTKAVEDTVYNEELTGQNLTDEEQRVEINANMNLLS